MLEEILAVKSGRLLRALTSFFGLHPLSLPAESLLRFLLMPSPASVSIETPSLVQPTAFPVRGYGRLQASNATYGLLSAIACAHSPCVITFYWPKWKSIKTQKYSGAVENKKKKTKKLDKPEAELWWQNFPWTPNNFNKIHKQGHFLLKCVYFCSCLFWFVSGKAKYSHPAKITAFSFLNSCSWVA